MARPKKPIDKQQLENLAERLWKVEHIAAHFRVDRKTIERRFGPLIQECYARGRAKLVDFQWQRVVKGSDRVLIHMSKHYLGQHDKVDIDAKVKGALVKVDRVTGGVVVGTRELKVTEGE